MECKRQRNKKQFEKSFRLSEKHNEHFFSLFSVNLKSKLKIFRGKKSAEQTKAAAGCENCVTRVGDDVRSSGWNVP
jgi:hypothetical protein